MSKLVIQNENVKLQLELDTEQDWTSCLMTALIAALAGGPAGVAIALVHFLFNVSGLLIFYPIPAIRRIPVRLAERIGQFAGESRKLTVLYTLCLFFGVPGLLILINCLI